MANVCCSDLRTLSQRLDMNVCVCVYLLAAQGHCSVAGPAGAAAALAALEAELGQGQGQDPAAAGGLYSCLDARCRSIVAPFLTTRFTQMTNRSEDAGGWLIGDRCETASQMIFCWLPGKLCSATHSNTLQHSSMMCLGQRGGMKACARLLYHLL